MKRNDYLSWKRIMFIMSFAVLAVLLLSDSEQSGNEVMSIPMSIVIMACSGIIIGASTKIDQAFWHLLRRWTRPDRHRQIGTRIIRPS